MSTGFLHQQSGLKAWFNRFKPFRQRFPTRLTVAGGALALALLLSFLGPVQRINMNFYYLFSQARLDMSSPVSLVLEAGELTAQEFGVWPWSHAQVSNFINGLFQMGAMTVVLDDSLLREGGEMSGGATLDEAVMKGGYVRMQILHEPDKPIEQVLMENGSKVYLTLSPKKNQDDKDIRWTEAPRRFAPQVQGYTQMETIRSGFSEYWVPSIAKVGGEPLVHAAARENAGDATGPV